MSRIPEVLSPVGVGSRWQSLGSLILVCLAVVVAPPGRREIVAAVGEIVRFVVGSGSESAPATPPVEPGPKPPTESEVVKVAQLLEALQRRHAEQSQRIAQLEQQPQTAQPAVSATPQAGPAPVAPAVTPATVPARGGPAERTPDAREPGSPEAESRPHSTTPSDSSRPALRPRTTQTYRTRTEAAE